MKKVAFDKKNVYLQAIQNDVENIEKIEQFVEDWSLHGGYGISIYDYLGITREQYADWLENPQEFYRVMKISYKKQ